MEVTIRKATESDLPELTRLFADSVQKIALQRYSPEQVAAWAATPSNPERFRQFILDKYLLNQRTSSPVDSLPLAVMLNSCGSPKLDCFGTKISGGQF